MNAGRTDVDAMAAAAREARRSGGAARGHVAVVLVGTSLVLAYATLAVVQILVLNPLAAAPGRTLSQIHRDLEAADQSLSPVLAVGIPALGVVLALVLGVVGMRSRTPVSTLALGYLVLLAAGTPAYFAASFGAGMSLADTYFIGGADHSPWSWPLHATSAAATVLVALAGAGRLLQLMLHAPRAGDHTPGTPPPR